MKMKLIVFCLAVIPLGAVAQDEDEVRNAFGKLASAYAAKNKEYLAQNIQSDFPRTLRAKVDYALSVSDDINGINQELNKKYGVAEGSEKLSVDMLAGFSIMDIVAFKGKISSIKIEGDSANVNVDLGGGLSNESEFVKKNVWKLKLDEQFSSDAQGVEFYKLMSDYTDFLKKARNGNLTDKQFNDKIDFYINKVKQLTVKK